MGNFRKRPIVVADMKNHTIELGDIASRRQEIGLASQTFGGKGSKALKMRISFDVENVAFAHYFVSKNGETIWGFSDIQDAINCYNETFI